MPNILQRLGILQKPTRLISPLKQEETIRGMVAGGKLISPLARHTPQMKMTFTPPKEGLFEKALEIIRRPKKWSLPVQNQSEERIRKKFPEVADTAVQVFLNESSLIPSKVGPMKERGLAQIYKKTFDDEKIEEKFGYTYDDMFDPDKNLDVARYLFDKYGWSPWRGADYLKAGEEV